MREVVKDDTRDSERIEEPTATQTFRRVVRSDRSCLIRLPGRTKRLYSEKRLVRQSIKPVLGETAGARCRGRRPRARLAGPGCSNSALLLFPAPYLRFRSPGL